jgi:hypothetical protein
MEKMSEPTFLEDQRRVTRDVDDDEGDVEPVACLQLSIAEV